LHPVTSELYLEVPGIFILYSQSLTVLKGWGAKMFQTQLRLLSASSIPHGKTVFSFTADTSHCNRLGNLHGGCAATLFDG
jgi:acyl-coenzyme A thioesterase PaaI-like protein